MSGTILSVRDLSLEYRSSRRGEPFRAIDRVSFAIAQGEIIGLVGESGSGKTTIARCISRLVNPTSGQILFRDEDIVPMSYRQLGPVRRYIKMVFQDPRGSLSPRMTVAQIVEEGLIVHEPALTRRQRRARVDAVLADVEIGTAMRDRRPRALSGGQCQRVAIARALAAGPKLLVCDEAVSALDVSIQAQICNLLLNLRDRLGLSVLFITHDLAVARQLCDRVIVMNEGRIVELAPTEQLFTKPQAEYTRELLASIPRPTLTVRPFLSLIDPTSSKVEGSSP